MKILFDLLPVILFFAAYKFADRGNQDQSCLTEMAESHLPFYQEPILLATGVAMLAALIQIAWLLLRKKKIDPMLWGSFAIITLFGGATIYFHNPTFIQWKPTILYWLMGTGLLVARYAFRTDLIRQAMSSQSIELPERVWGQLNWMWVICFIVLGAVNLVAMQHLSCSDWVSFKLYGLTGIMFVFVVLQGFWLGKYIK